MVIRINYEADDGVSSHRGPAGSGRRWRAEVRVRCHCDLPESETARACGAPWEVWVEEIAALLWSWQRADVGILPLIVVMPFATGGPSMFDWLLATPGWRPDIGPGRLSKTELR